MPTRLPVVFAACCAATAFAPAADPPVVTREFKMLLTVEITEGLGDKAETFSGETGFRYAWERGGKRRTLLVREMSIKSKIGDREMRNATFDRGRTVFTENGKKSERKYDDLAEPVQRVLRDTFDTPLYRLEFDDAGREVKRTTLAGPGAKIVVDTGLLTNVMLFHPPYFIDKDEWQISGAVSVGHGEAAGKLTYKKTEGGKGGQAVKVDGTLEVPTVEGEGPVAKDAKYVISGTQTYDTRREEWVATDLDMTFSFAMPQGEKKVGRVKGKMKFTIEMLPEKK